MTKLIESITDEQKKLIKTYREEFKKIGLSTQRCNRPKAEAAIKELQEFLGQRGDKPFIWFDGFKTFFAWAKENVDSTSYNDLYYSWSGQSDAYFLSTYCYINEILPVKKYKGGDISRRVIESIGFYYIFDEAIVCIDRPTKLSYNEQQRADASGGPYMEFADGTKIYAIDGVRVKNPEDIKNYILPSPEELDIKSVLNINNVDLRRAVLNKVGPERLLKELNAKHLDSVELDIPTGDILEGIVKTGLYSKEDRPALIKHLNSVKSKRLYDLYEIDFGSFKGRYLKMENPSIEGVHIEGVSNNCNTVEDALRFRDNKTEDSPAFSAILS